MEEINQTFHVLGALLRSLKNLQLINQVLLLQAFSCLFFMDRWGWKWFSFISDHSCIPDETVVHTGTVNVQEWPSSFVWIWFVKVMHMLHWYWISYSLSAPLKPSHLKSKWRLKRQRWLCLSTGVALCKRDSFLSSTSTWRPSFCNFRIIGLTSAKEGGYLTAGICLFVSKTIRGNRNVPKGAKGKGVYILWMFWILERTWPLISQGSRTLHQYTEVRDQSNKHCITGATI